MLVNMTSLNRQLRDTIAAHDDVREFAKWFWQFSRYYGDHISTPVQHRYEMDKRYPR